MAVALAAAAAYGAFSLARRLVPFVPSVSSTDVALNDAVSFALPAAALACVLAAARGTRWNAPGAIGAAAVLALVLTAGGVLLVRQQARTGQTYLAAVYGSCAERSWAYVHCS